MCVCVCVCVCIHSRYVLLVGMSVWLFIFYLSSYEFCLVDCCVDYRPTLQQTCLEN